MARTVHIAERPVHLRPKEFDLLATLVGRSGAVVSREDLMSEVWDEHWSGPTKTLDVHVAALRRKLIAMESPGHIVTARGYGYRYDAAGGCSGHLFESLRTETVNPSARLSIWIVDAHRDDRKRLVRPPR